MSEQLAMVVRDNRLEARGPLWRWWEMDGDHWVGYPDRRIKVENIDDDWLRNILTYLASWTEPRVEALVWAWWGRSAYFTVRAMSESSEDCVGVEMRQLEDQTHREWLEKFLIPCLPTLEAEARRRGFEVPPIPSYTCRFTKARAQAKADWDEARQRALASPLSPFRGAVRTRKRHPR